SGISINSLITESKVSMLKSTDGQWSYSVRSKPVPVFVERTVVSGAVLSVADNELHSFGSFDLAITDKSSWFVVMVSAILVLVSHAIRQLCFNCGLKKTAGLNRHRHGSNLSVFQDSSGCKFASIFYSSVLSID
ncbi:8480_t:CDS:2, partial [Funneliformis caledonium]